MSVKKLIFPLIFKLLLTTLFFRAQSAPPTNPVRGHVAGGGEMGEWVLLLNNTGVVAMHMALTRDNTVVIFDQTSSGPSGYQLRHSADGRRCLGLSRSLTDPACSAHSVEYHIGLNSIRPLTLQTDTWCSSGSLLSNGLLLQTGGYYDGYRRIRSFAPCRNGRCDWRESSMLLTDNRWYASNLLLPENDTTIVVGGIRTFTYEFVPKRSSGEGSFSLPFLRDTNDRNEHGNNLYPFVHLLPNGNLFIFANRDSILLDYKQNRVIKTYPRIPGGSRNYPSSGSSVILPLDHSNAFQDVEVLVCGGSARGAYTAARQGNFFGALTSCGRMLITGDKNQWAIEHMPGPRLLNDMLILPTGNILIINGAKQGTAGWNNAAVPSLQPYLYNPRKQTGRRFSTLQSTNIARMYHSSALLLPDGRVLVAGSNPHNRYTFGNVSYPTELRLQAFVPHYMAQTYDINRPHNVSVQYAEGAFGVHYNEGLTIRFLLARKPGSSQLVDMNIEVNIYSPPFTTHGVSMNQRMLNLKLGQISLGTGGWCSAVIQAPPSANVAPAGYYMLTVVNQGIPSISTWIRLIQY